MSKTGKEESKEITSQFDLTAEFSFVSYKLFTGYVIPSTSIKVCVCVYAKDGL